MTKTGRSDRLRELRRAGQIALGIAISLFPICGLIGLRINSSPSLSIGLYVTTEEGGANLAEFCPAQPFAGMAIERGYRDAGVCLDGAAPLLKPVVARSGDVVDYSRCGIREPAAEHGPDTDGYQGTRADALAVREVYRTSRYFMGGIFVSSPKLR
jgi:type IV secretory pathway protease TraF